MELIWFAMSGSVCAVGFYRAFILGRYSRKIDIPMMIFVVLTALAGGVWTN